MLVLTEDFLHRITAVGKVYAGSVDSVCTVYARSVDSSVQPSAMFVSPNRASGPVYTSDAERHKGINWCEIDWSRRSAIYSGELWYSIAAPLVLHSVNPPFFHLLVVYLHCFLCVHLLLRSSSSLANFTLFQLACIWALKRLCNDEVTYVPFVVVVTSICFHLLCFLISDVSIF